MELFTKIVNGGKSLTIVAKTSIVDLPLGLNTTVILPTSISLNPKLFPNYF